MPTVVSRPHNKPLEPNFLLNWEAGRDASSRRAALAGTAAVHALAIAVLMLVPSESVLNRRPAPEPRITPLVDPLVLTQKAPNPNKPSNTVSLDALMAPQFPRPRIAQKLNLPPLPPPAPAAAPKVMAEAPKLEAPKPEPNKAAGVLNNFPQPAAPAPAQPKLVLEVPSAPKPVTPTGRLAVPNANVEEAVKNLAHAGGSSNAVGDIVPDIYSSRSPSPGPPRAAVGLKSDPLGVDFRPYLQQVLQAVKRNWFAVMPESARLGQRGQVVLIFGVNKDGKITKIVFSTESGAQPLDRAAVAALSASDPLPRLPVEYKGASVALQFTFQYNAPRH